VAAQRARAAARGRGAGAEAAHDDRRSRTPRGDAPAGAAAGGCRAHAGHAPGRWHITATLAASFGTDRVRRPTTVPPHCAAGRLFGESEATASRKLERIRRHAHRDRCSARRAWAELCRGHRLGRWPAAPGTVRCRSARVPAPQVQPPSFKGRRTP
jgi:hypothetical protein